MVEDRMPTLSLSTDGNLTLTTREGDLPVEHIEAVQSVDGPQSGYARVTVTLLAKTATPDVEAVKAPPQSLSRR